MFQQRISRFATLVGACLIVNAACTREQPTTTRTSASANAPTRSSAATTPSGAPTAPPKASVELPPPAPDPAYDAFGEAQQKHCKLEADAAWSNVDMARWARSLERCFVRRASGIVARMPSEQRLVVNGGSRFARGEAWYADWSLFAHLSSELGIRTSFTSGSTHMGGTLLITMRPASMSGVAQEIMYWLHSVTAGSVGRRFFLSGAALFRC